MISQSDVPTEQRAALAIVTSSSGEVLLQLRDDIPGIAHPGCWGFPGGSLEAGEEPLAAVQRELLEEIGVWFHEAQPLFELTDAREDGGNGKLLTIFHTQYLGAVEDLVLGEGRELRFFPLTRLPAPVPSHVTEALARFQP